ncbi:MAG: hypothetical protein DMF63_05490 [Acidobacteria bacterium]|nr:MAG: hypothetical protein DMF63_05490 [Acidobacteriota bacterium]
MKRLIPIFAGAFLLTLGLFVQSASAQSEDVTRLIKQLEEDSDRFSNSATKALDKSEYDGTAREDELIRAVRGFEDSVDKLKQAHDNARDTYDNAKVVQAKSIAINKWLKNHSLGSTVATDWGTVKATLLRLKALVKEPEGN